MSWSLASAVMIFWLDRMGFVFVHCVRNMEKRIQGVHDMCISQLVYRWGFRRRVTGIVGVGVDVFGVSRAACWVSKIQSKREA